MFLDRLLARTLGESALLTPRRASRFEGKTSGFEERVEESLAPPRTVPGAMPPLASIAPVPPPPAERCDGEAGEPAAPPSTPERGGGPDTPPVLREVHTVELRQVPAASRSEPPTIEPADRSRAEPPPREPRREGAGDHAVEAKPPSVWSGEVRAERHDIEHRFETLVRERTTERVIEMRDSPPRPPAKAGRAQAEPSSARPVMPRKAPQPPPAPPPNRRTALAERVAQPEPATQAPMVHVTIGRVEVRAVQAPVSKPSAELREPGMGLDDYLARRERA